MPEVIINGPEGRLEGRYHHAKQTNAPIALLLHPHLVLPMRISEYGAHSATQREGAQALEKLLATNGLLIVEVFWVLAARMSEIPLGGERCVWYPNKVEENRE